MKRFKIIYLELTNACNFSCDYCPIDRQTRRLEVMPADFARNVIDQIADHDLTEFLTFHLMGEPYLHKQLAELTAHAEARGLKVRLLTNGSLLDPTRNRALFEAGLTRLEVGFRTPNDRSFELRLKRRESLALSEYKARVESLLEDKVRLQPRTEICVKFFIRSHGSLLGLQDRYDHLTSRSDNEDMAHHFQRCVLEAARRHGVSTRGFDDVAIHAANGEHFVFPGISFAFSRIQDFWVREQRGPGGSQRYPARFGGCSAGFRDDFGILASGEVTTCCVDYDGRNVVGSLREKPLMEVLASDAALHVERSFRRFRPPTPFCRQCLGGPTLASSLLKQASSIAVDVRDRVKPRKAYRDLRKRLD